MAFWLYLVLITEFILFVFAYIVFKGDFISPSVVTLVLFIVSTFCFVLNVNKWDVVFTFKEYILFTFSFILMIFTEYFISKTKIIINKRKGINRYKVSKKEWIPFLYIKTPWNYILFIFFSMCGLIYIYRVIQSGNSVGATGLFVIGANKEEADFDSLSRLLFNLLRFASYFYVLIICQNVIGCHRKLREYLKESIVIILAVVSIFFSGQRNTLICYIIEIVVAVVIILHDKNRIGKNFNKFKFLKKITILAIFLIIVFFARSNIVKNTSIERHFVEYVTYYFGGTTALMGKIVENPSICHSQYAGYFGEKTFNGFYNTLYSWGLLKKEPARRLWIRLGGMSSSAGNEYTFFCGPYIDFGTIGTFIFIICFYAFFSYIYYWEIRKKEQCKKRFTVCVIYLYLFSMIALSFYEDTIRSYVRPINIIYLIYVIAFSKIFLRIENYHMET